MAVTTSNGDGFALYNGVKFLKMLEYDKVKYPYAYLSVYDASGGTDMYKGETIAELRLSSMPFTAYPSEDKAEFIGTFDQALYFGINGEQIAADNANIGFVDGEWVLSFKQDNMTTTEAGAYITLSELTWCNQDLLNADGSVNFPTTNPIPLDGMNVIEWDGDTTGLEVMDDMYFKVSDSVPSVSAGDTVIVALASNVSDIPPAFTDTLVEEDGYLSDSSQLGQAAVVFSNVEGSTGVGFVKFDLGEQYIYTSLVAYPASGGGSTYDRTAFLSGMAMGLSGEGDPTFETSDTFTKGYLVGAELRKKRVIPEVAKLAESNTWYKGSANKSSFTEINLVDTYVETGTETESWAADANETGAIMCYVDGTVLTIAGDGRGKIVANEKSSSLFNGFQSVTTISNLSLLDTSNATTMRHMFYNCSSLTSLDVTNFSTSNVKDMRYMFFCCSSLNSLDVSNFDTSNVINMNDMFYNCSSLTSLNVTNFDTSSVTNMSYMFSACSALTLLDVSNFDTSNVINMSDMFFGCSSLTSLDVINFDTSSVTNMNDMFAYCSSLTSLDVANFDTSNVTDMSFMFRCCRALTSLDVTNFDTSNVTNTSYMFGYCEALSSLDVTNFNTSKVADMRYMFYNCSALTSLDLTSFDTSKTTNMGQMFYYCKGLTVIYVGDGWTTENADTANMFTDCGVSSVTRV